MLSCPRCASPRVHRSRSRSWFERLRREFTQNRLFRCDACGWRGWGVELETPSSRQPITKPPTVDVPAPDLAAMDESLAQTEPVIEDENETAKRND